ncbi:MAG: NAD(P)-dependent oxidoreductase [Alphaproteobacteria bacterium]|nr:MAG: NAD(P)-dependent oxidoreductase [Alphaproteobacteria bacterium]PZO35587.1 MAG: NAD(P)-dependent oxidoreductase [Alphaproteobacteria bacterium]
MRDVFVTGASGNVGRAVIAALESRGARFRIGDRRPAGLMPFPNCDVVEFNFLDAATYGPAVAGCNTVFLLRPPAISNTGDTLNRFIDVARAAGVDHIVFVSVVGAGSNPLVPHHAVEHHLRHGPPGWTILRPGFFAQNLESTYRRDIQNDDRIYVPAGRGKVAFIDTRDLANVAVQALLDPLRHAGQAYTLTGPVALSFAEVADLLSSELKRTVRYTPASTMGYIRHLLDAGTPLIQALVQSALHVGLRFGQAERVDPTLGRLMDRPALTMAQYVHDRRTLWMAR